MSSLFTPTHLSNLYFGVFSFSLFLTLRLLLTVEGGKLNQGRVNQE